MTNPLDRAVDARIDSYRPDVVPPFTAVEGRRRSRDRRRLAFTGVVLPAVALAALLTVVPLLDGGDNERLAPDVAGELDPAADALVRQCVPGPFFDRTEDYRGLSEQQAQEKARSEGGSTAVVVRDGECQTVLTNLDPRRVSLSVVNGKVTWAGQEAAAVGSARP